MKYILPKGTKITFRDTLENREALGCGGEDDEYYGFALGAVYEISGVDEHGECFFYDAYGDMNYAGFAMDGSDGVFEVVCA